MFAVADAPLQDNFAASSTNGNCFCSCGAFGPIGLGLSCPSSNGVFSIIDDLDNAVDNDDDYFVHGYDGQAGSIYLTSTSTLDLCPSTVTFDFSVGFRAGLSTAQPPFEDRTLMLQVIDDSDNVILSVPVPRATVVLSDGTFFRTVNSEKIDLSGPTFSACTPDLRMRFAWNLPQDFTGPGQFILDNVYVIPITSSMPSSFPSSQPTT
eukprot:scaffold195153_cov43-Attheya_sp.AAC.1